MYTRTSVARLLNWPILRSAVALGASGVDCPIAGADPTTVEFLCRCTVICDLLFGRDKLSLGALSVGGLPSRTFISAFNHQT